ncbi:N-acetyltransferase [Cytophagales bacterium WSM2-2]|nr:N-acetyltransferase [Cytophagales bacterium WSM2-2]
MDLELREITTELEKVYPLMKELRPKLTLEDFITIYQQANAGNHYKIIGAYSNNDCIALMGYRILHDYVHGKHLYIDDLVTSAAHQSKGAGAKLLKEAEVLAKKSGCNYVRLCTGIENERGKEFYDREGFKLRAVVYKKQIA